MLPHCQLLVEQYAEITHKLRWLNDVSANTKCKIHVQNFLEVCFRPKPDDFRLRRVELESPRGAPSMDLLDALLHSVDGYVDLGKPATVNQLCIICFEMMAELMAINQTRQIISV